MGDGFKTKRANNVNKKCLVSSAQSCQILGFGFGYPGTCISKLSVGIQNGAACIPAKEDTGFLLERDFS